MKKVMIAVPFMLIFCLGQLFSQKNTFNLGIEGGTNLTFLHKHTSLFPPNQRFGFASGVSFQYNFSKRVGIKTGINFERRIITERFEFIDENGQIIGDTRYNVRFDYVIVPLMGRITWANKGKFYYVNAGPHMGYLLRQTEELGGFVTDNTDVFENLDIGLSVGFGSMIPINQNLYLTLEIRNNLGLRDMLTTDQSIKTNAVNILAGIAYRL